jgi:tetratricopeptide (TPR) repeat protein
LKSRKKKSKAAPAPRAEIPPTPARQWLFRCIALFVIPLLLLGAIEAGLRLGGYGYDTSLFKKISIGGQEFFVNNDAFGLRFFPPQLARGLGPIRMPAQKPAGTYRIFILGESAAMGDPEPSYGAGRYLEALLSARFPKTHFEIVNLGITAINSHVILPIARDCARRDGDLWIIYMGNNEMVGPFGAATVFGAKTPPLPLIRLNLAIQKTRLGQLLINVARKLKSGGASATAWGGMEMFVGNQLPADDPRKEIVYQNFSRNLRDIVKTGLDSGANILLNTVAVNLKDCAPFASLTNSNLPAADRAQFEQLYAAGCAAESENDFASAAKNFEAAAAFDRNCADLQFRFGESLLQLTNFAAAREHLQLACDDDALPFRADSRINGAIEKTGREFAGNQMTFFDAAAALASGAPSGISGDETFYEHVHFNFHGSYQLARAWAGQIEKILPVEISRAAATNAWASQEVCERRLGLSDWNRALIFQHMIGRLQQPPLSGQLGNAARVKNLQMRVDELHSQMNAASAARAKENFLAALQNAPDDYFLRENFALFLQSTGDLPSATAEWRRIHDFLPHDYLAYFQLGRMLELQNLWPEAENNLRRAVELRATLTDGWIELGNALASQEKFSDALASYATAEKQRPQDSQIIFRTGIVLAKLNRHADAMENFRAAIKLNPADWEPHFELGGELDSAGQLDAAREEFGEATRLNPGNARAHFNFGVLLAKQNRLDDARREFEETLRLEPGYEKARTYLAQIQSLKNRVP